MVRFMGLRPPVHVNGGCAARWSGEGMVRAASHVTVEPCFSGI